jgi:hypothetical protein
MADPLRIQYQELTGVQGEVVLRPLLPLSLGLDSATITASGLLDTGADINVLPYRAGLALGAIWEKQPLLATLSGNLGQHEARGILLSGIVGGFDGVPLVFAWTRSEQLPLILGQVNLFQEFDICFFRAEAAFEIQPKRSHVS